MAFSSKRNSLGLTGSSADLNSITLEECFQSQFPLGDVKLPVFGGTLRVVGLSVGTVLFSPLTWTVRELERRTLAYLPDSHLPADESVALYLSGCEKSGGRLVFSAGIAGRNSNGDEVGSY